MNNLFGKMKCIVENFNPFDNWEKNLQTAQNPQADPLELDDLAKNNWNHFDLMQHIVKNPNATMSTRLKALGFHDELVPDFLENPNLPLDAMENNIFDVMPKEDYVNHGLHTLASNPLTSHFFQGKLLTQQDPDRAIAIKQGLAKNPNLHPDLAEAMYRETTPHLFKDDFEDDLLQNPNLRHKEMRSGLRQTLDNYKKTGNEEDLNIFSQDHPVIHDFLKENYDHFRKQLPGFTKEYFYKALLKNPKLDPEILQHLAGDTYFSSDNAEDLLTRLAAHPNHNEDSLLKTFFKVKNKMNANNNFIHLLNNPNTPAEALRGMTTIYHYPAYPMPDKILNKIKQHPNFDQETQEFLTDRGF